MSKHCWEHDRLDCKISIHSSYHLLCYSDVYPGYRVYQSLLNDLPAEIFSVMSVNRVDGQIEIVLQKNIKLTGFPNDKIEVPPNFNESVHLNL
jgi:hypothetical protein